LEIIQVNLVGGKKLGL